MMHADATRVRQILFNLLSNAAKFTTQGTVTLSVTRMAGHRSEQLHPEGEARRAGQVAFRVADTGIGMSQAHLQGLFQAFTQVNTSLARQHGGTGLGLAITQRIVAAHSGEIAVRSQVGQGSCFTVRLPLRMAAPS
ncbi:MAG: hypothetical protein HC915_20475 [Anaerolineae bacterium]|nr:hypothetical protein [Anaerolineae bacterium]